MKKDRLMPRRRFIGFNEEWEQRKLAEMADFSKGNGYSKADLVEEGHPVILYGRLYTKYETVIENIDTFAELKEKSVISKGGEVIVPASGETPEEISRASVVDIAGVALGGDLNIIKTNDLDPTFLALTISNGSQQKEMSKRAQGKSVVHLHNSDLKAVNLLFPKVEEQKEIGSFFKQLDLIITLQQRKLEKLQELKKAYLYEMFPTEDENIPKRRFSGFTGAWEQRKLGELGSTFTGLTGKTKEDFGHGNAKFVTYVNVFQNAVASLEQLDSIEVDPRQNEVKKGDVFFTTSSETPEEVGMASVWKYDYHNVYLNSFTFGYRPNVEFDLDYLASMLRSTAVRKKITFLAQGISRYNISKTKMMDIEVPVPSMAEQEKIGEFFVNLDKTITLQQRKIEKLQELKQAYLNDMFV